MGIDYNAEIPFLKKPPLSFYDVTDEENRPPVEQPKFPITIEQLEGEREGLIRKLVLENMDVSRNKIAQRQGAPVKYNATQQAYL